MKKLIKLLIFCTLAGVSAFSQHRSSEEMIYDGFDQVLGMGIDSTGHYWFVSSSSSGYKSIHIDNWTSEKYESIRNLVFSNDGERWAFFGKDNVSWNLVTNDTAIALFCDDVATLGFSPSSEVIYYSYMQGSEAFYVIGNRTIRGVNATGDIYVSLNAERFAIGGWRGDRKVYTLQGWETPPYDDIKPLGFWNDGSFIYIAKIGNGWEIYKDKEPISEPFLDITEFKLNRDGTVAAFLAKRSQNTSVGILLSDEYYEPLISYPYEHVYGLALHPTLPLMAYVAQENNTEFVVMSNTRYAGGQKTGIPSFTHDGSQLYFPGCASDCFINIDGRRYNLYQMFDMMDNFVMKPGSKTIAYSTSSSLVVRYLETKELVAGMMVDTLIKPIFDWRRDSYVTLGAINQRIYLLKCKV